MRYSSIINSFSFKRISLVLFLVFVLAFLPGILEKALQSGSTIYVASSDIPAGTRLEMNMLEKKVLKEGSSPGKIEEGTYALETIRKGMVVSPEMLSASEVDRPEGMKIVGVSFKEDGLSYTEFSPGERVDLTIFTESSGVYVVLEELEVKEVKNVNSAFEGKKSLVYLFVTEDDREKIVRSRTSGRFEITRSY